MGNIPQPSFIVQTFHRSLACFIAGVPDSIDLIHADPQLVKLLESIRSTPNSLLREKLRKKLKKLRKIVCNLNCLNSTNLVIAQLIWMLLSTFTQQHQKDENVEVSVLFGELYHILFVKPAVMEKTNAN